MNYSGQLNDPRWKKKRVEILIRDKHKCRICNYFGSKVNIHHLKYSGMAWDVSNDDLITLCNDCHSKLHTDKRPVGKSIKEIIKLWQKDS